MKQKELTLLFLTRKNEVLLAMKKRGFGVGRWNGVGGKLDVGETVEQAMQRECREEIEVEVTDFEKVAEIELDEYKDGEPIQVNVHVFKSDTWKGEPAETEEMAPKWFKSNELPLNEMWPDDPYWLPQVIEGKKIQAKFKLDEDDTIIHYEVNETEELNDD